MQGYLEASGIDNLLLNMTVPGGRIAFLAKYQSTKCYDKIIKK
jgi:hypothetical protein